VNKLKNASEKMVNNPNQINKLCAIKQIFLRD